MLPSRWATTTVSGSASSRAGGGRVRPRSSVMRSPSPLRVRRIAQAVSCGWTSARSEGVAHPQPGRVRGDQLLQPVDAGALDVVAVAHVPLAVLAALGLLDVRAPEQFLGL